MVFDLFILRAPFWNSSFTNTGIWLIWVNTINQILFLLLSTMITITFTYFYYCFLFLPCFLLQTKKVHHYFPRSTRHTVVSTLGLMSLFGKTKAHHLTNCIGFGWDSTKIPRIWWNMYWVFFATRFHCRIPLLCCLVYLGKFVSWIV